MNTPPRSPSPSPLTIHLAATKPANTLAQQAPPSTVGNMSLPTSTVKASPPRTSPAGPDQDMSTNANDPALRVNRSSGPASEVTLEDSEHDKEAASSNSASSEEVEIYLNELGLDNGVRSDNSGRACGVQNADEPSAADSPLLPRGRTFDESHWSRRTTTSSSQEPGPPLLTPTNLDSEATPLSINNRDIPKGTAISTPTSNTTSDITIDAGPTTNTTNDTNSGLPSTPTRRPSRHLHPVDIRNQLLSPVGDPIDSPIIPPATRMSTVPLPDMDDHDDPTNLLPRSMEQMHLQETHVASGRNALDRARMRGLTLGTARAMVASTPPPTSPLPPLPNSNGMPPLTASPSVGSFALSNSGFGQAMLDTSTSSRSGSIPSTPPIGIQPSSSYTQSQPLPQLPTFAPGLSVINEGGPGLSKDDLHLGMAGDGRRDEYANGYSGESEELQMNRAELHQQRRDPNPNVTILPVYQQYGTITVSNSVVSFPNSPSATSESVAGTTGSSNDFTQGLLPNSASSTSFAGQQKTANVYINGLPPHFPEEQLEALAAPFGEVKSVRTFTRHVRDSESGYGFVLFATIDAAERCIIALRKYRNLHPTFSKQVHKIPGTIYSNSNANNQADGSSGGFHSASESEDGDATFKARMEALADPTSTNLYMEGLPLSMDDAALSALVSPHRVISNRFFQTRLSNPPRIIAFVRLETRAGAEEVIERLHGKMVRGWNDAGSRISVRFADTAEQRELRRQERTVKEGEPDGEPSTGQLTIAQAALLNLRGQDLRIIGTPSPNSALGVASLPSVTSNLAMNPPVIGSTSQRVADWANTSLNAGVSGISGREIIGSSREYGMASGLDGVGGQGLALGGPNGIGGARTAGLGNGASGIDYGSAFAGTPIGSIGSAGGLPPHQLRQYQDVLSDGMGGFQMDYVPSQRDSTSMGHQMRGGAVGRDGMMMDPAMKALLESLGGGGIDQQQQQDFYRMQLERGSPSPYVQNLPQASINQLLQYPNYGGSGVASTVTGYTPAEEYIMRAHAENISRQRDLQQHQSGAQRKRPSPLDLGRQSGGRRQDESGADIAMGVRGYRMQAALVGMSDEEAFHAHARAEMEAEQQQRMDLTSVDQQEHHHAHTRSTTLPHQQQNQQRRNSMMTGPHATSVVVGGPSASGRGQSRHYQHNSMSISSTTALRTPQHASVATMGGQIEQQQATGQKLGYRNSYGSQQQHSQNPRQQQQTAGSQGYEDSLSHSPTTPSTDSSSLISPALTYSSQHTPSTLSPATPFFGSFGQGDAFRGAGVVEGKGAMEHGKPHSLKTRIA